MKVPGKIAAASAVLALGLAPAALAAGNGHANTHGKSATATSNAKKYGKICQGEGKTHVKGQKGTPFSNCVADMAKAAKNTKMNGARTCANETKTHVKGQKGSPYSQCVTAYVHLRNSEKH